MKKYVSSSVSQFDPSIDYHYLDGLKDFKNWFLSLIEEARPELIVGIARGAIRLLQLEKITDILSSVPIISDHALPFLDESLIKDKRVLIFDDSVIFGSTFSNVRNYVLQKGAVPICAAYCADRMSFYGDSEDERQIIEPSIHSSLPIQIKNKFWPIELRRHHDILTRSILQTPNHYNLDFPTLILHTTSYKPFDIPFICRLLGNSDNIADTHDVSTSSTSMSSVYRYSAFLKNSVNNIYSNDSIHFQPNAKLRISFLPNLNQIRITPIIQLLFTRDISFAEITFTSNIISDIWRSLRCPIYGDKYYSQALFRLLTLYHSILIGISICDDIKRTFKDELSIKNYELLKEDVSYVVGSDNAEILSKLTSIPSNILLFSNDTANSDTNVDEFPINTSLIELTIKEWTKRQHLKPQTGETLYEQYGKVFLTLRAITDDRKARMRNPEVSRIEVGLSKTALRELLSDCCNIDSTSKDIELALDMCVDNGQAVPKILFLNGILHRAFYSGENEDSQDISQLQLSLFSAYTEFLKAKKTRPLTQYDFHKLLVTLKDIFPYIPISTRYYTYGRCANIGKREEELIPWLTNDRSGPFYLDTKGNTSILLPKMEFKPIVKSTWPSSRTRDFIDGFHYIATSFNSLKSEAKLLISTCRTHRHTYNAVAYEVHGWFSHEYGNFCTLLSGLRDSGVVNGNIDEKYIYDLCWAAIRISEAEKKYNIFHSRYKKTFGDIEKTFKRQGLHAHRYWRYFIYERNFITDDLDPEIEYRFKLLLPILHQIRSLTIFIVTALVQLNILSRNKISEILKKLYFSDDLQEFSWLFSHDLDEIIFKYNSLINTRKMTGSSIVNTTLPGKIGLPGNVDDLNSLLDIADNCFSELKTVLSEFCPEYEVIEGDFPYSPDGSKRPLKDGRIERTVDNVYILALDIIGSTNSKQTNEMKEIVLHTLERFSSLQRIYYEYTQNDCFLVCSHNILALLDISKKISLEGERLKSLPGEKFSGTRKGISFGTISVIEGPDNKYLIKDAKIPNVIPAAVGIINGIDDQANNASYPRNKAIIFDKLAYDRLRDFLNLDKKASINAMVKSKHSYGPCYIFNLTEI